MSFKDKILVKTYSDKTSVLAEYLPSPEIYVRVCFCKYYDKTQFEVVSSEKEEKKQ